MKNYVKPAISFQFMTLADEVSGGCNMKANSAEYVCPVEVPDRPGETVFSDYNVCFMTPEDSGMNICVSVPTGGDFRVLGS